MITAETGADMSQFPTASHLASWAGTSPGSKESAGRVKTTKTRPGNPYLKGALRVAAMSAARTKNTYLGAKYRRIASRRGPIKAIVAIEHAMLTAIWNVATTGALYDDPGADLYTRRTPDEAKHRAIEQLRLRDVPSHPRAHRVIPGACHECQGIFASEALTRNREGLCWWQYSSKVRPVQQQRRELTCASKGLPPDCGGLRASPSAKRSH